MIAGFPGMIQVAAQAAGGAPSTAEVIHHAMQTGSEVSLGMMGFAVVMFVLYLLLGKI